MTASQMKDNDHAVRMIIFVACLNYAMVDVQCELEALGKFRQQTKRYYNLANKAVMEAHTCFFNMLTSKKEFGNAMQQYLMHSDKTWDNIVSHIYLDGIEGAVNKALSLCRLAMKYNYDLKGRYDCYLVYKLDVVIKYLIGLGIKDYNMDFAIEQQMSY